MGQCARSDAFSQPDRRRPFLRLLQEPGLCKAHVSAVADHHMVVQRDVQHPACLQKLSGNRAIVRARRRIAAWVIVKDDDTSRVRKKRRLIDFARRDGRTVERALAYEFDTAHIALHVEVDRVKTFAIALTKAPKLPVNVGWASNVTGRPVPTLPHQLDESAVANPRLAVKVGCVRWSQFSFSRDPGSPLRIDASR